MNYHPIMAEAETPGVTDVTAFLREELPRRWMADYKDATPRPTNILRLYSVSPSWLCSLPAAAFSRSRAIQK